MFLLPKSPQSLSQTLIGYIMIHAKYKWLSLIHRKRCANYFKYICTMVFLENFQKIFFLQLFCLYRRRYFIELCQDNKLAILAFKDNIPVMLTSWLVSEQWINNVSSVSTRVMMWIAFPCAALRCALFRCISVWRDAFFKNVIWI